MGDILTQEKRWYQKTSTKWLIASVVGFIGTIGLFGSVLSKKSEQISLAPPVYEQYAETEKSINSLDAYINNFDRRYVQDSILQLTEQPRESFLENLVAQRQEFVERSGNLENFAEVQTFKEMQEGYDKVKKFYDFTLIACMLMCVYGLMDIIDERHNARMNEIYGLENG